MKKVFEASIQKCDDWWIGWVDTVPGANSQAKTKSELKENLKEAVELILESEGKLIPEQFIIVQKPENTNM